MVKTQVFSNLDLSGEMWPSELPDVPRVGERIQSRRKHGVFQLTLEVVSVCWKFFEQEREWIAEIELHDPQKRSILEFYEWYASLVGKSVSAFI